jgi:hypothetical protein
MRVSDYFIGHALCACHVCLFKSSDLAAFENTCISSQRLALLCFNVLIIRIFLSHVILFSLLGKSPYSRVLSWPAGGTTPVKQLCPQGRRSASSSVYRSQETFHILWNINLENRLCFVGAIMKLHRDLHFAYKCAVEKDGKMRSI